MIMGLLVNCGLMMTDIYVDVNTMFVEVTVGMSEVKGDSYWSDRDPFVEIAHLMGYFRL